LNGITALVLTLNEEANIARTLARLSWVDEVLVVDSQSTDATVEIASGHPNVRVLQRAFTTHAEQWNFGLEQVRAGTRWVLALDADFVLTDALVREIQALDPDPAINGYAASFTYCIEGRPLRGAAYPPVTVLFRPTHAVYEQDGHTQRIKVAGAVATLAARILHDDRKPLSRWLAAQVRYMRLEAEKLSGTASAQLSIVDRVRKAIVVMPPAMFGYCYLWRGAFLDGKAGLYYALQRTAAELLLSLFLLQRLIRRDAPDQ
jgi:glycosyltransferase involved in cell wall biosynthesis